MEPSLHEQTGRTSQLVDAVGLAALTVALSLPFLFSGAGFYREDWKALADARFTGWWAAGDVSVARRPLGAALYSVIYGPIGNHPRLAFMALLAVNVAVTVMLLVVARQLLDRWTSVAVVFLFLLLPSRSSLVHWVSAINIQAGLLVLLVGTWLIIRALQRDRVSWAGVAVVMVSTVVYDPTVLAAALVLVVAPRLITGRFRRDLTLAAAGLLAIRLPWSALTATGHAEPIRWADAFSSNFGWGVVAPRPLWIGLQIVVLIGLAVTALRLVQRRGRADREGLVVAGVVLLGVGIAPFVQAGSDIDFVAIGDRANFIAAIGAACVFVGLIRMIPVSTTVATVAVVALGLACLPLRAQQDQHWEQTWTASRTLLDQARDRVAEGHLHLTYGPDIVACGAVEGLSGDLSDALHIWVGSRQGSLTYSATPAATSSDHLDTRALHCTTSTPSRG